MLGSINPFQSGDGGGGGGSGSSGGSAASLVAESPFVYLQCALLYTTAAGERALRVHNLRLTSTAQLSDAFRWV